MSEITYCNSCDNVALNSRKSPPWRWQCVKFPRIEGFGFVTDEEWTNYPPYAYCRDLNYGACPLWKPRREAPDEGASAKKS